jgi:hypothetical protein
MFLNEKNIEDMQVLTEEERQNAELIKQRQDYKSSPVSVYYGSDKDELDNVCLTCKKYLTCQDRIQAEEQGNMLRNAANIKKFTEKFSEEEIEKLKNNVFIIIKCINKEERGEI